MRSWRSFPGFYLRSGYAIGLGIGGLALLIVPYSMGTKLAAIVAGLAVTLAAAAYRFRRVLIDSQPVAELGRDVHALLDDLRSTASKTLGLTADASPEVVLIAIEEFVKRSRSERSADDQLDAVGAALGEQYCRGLGWHWVELDRDGEEVHLGVMEPGQRFGIRPFAWLVRLVQQPEAPVRIEQRYTEAASGTRLSGKGSFRWLE